MTLTGKLDPTTIILVLIAAVMVTALAVTHAITGQTIDLALTFVLGIIGGVVNPLAKSPANTVTPGL